MGDANAASNTRVTDIDNNHVVTICYVAEYGTCNADTINARRFGATFLDGENSFMLDYQDVLCHTDIGVWNRR